MTSRTGLSGKSCASAGTAAASSAANASAACRVNRAIVVLPCRLPATVRACGLGCQPVTEAGGPASAAEGSPPPFRDRSGAPAQEVGDQPEPGRLALLRVELGADRLSRPTTAVTGPPWSARASSCVRVLRHEVVGVHEIGVVAGGDAGEHRVRRQDLQRVPAHVRDLQRPGRRARGAPPRRGSSRSPGVVPVLAARGSPSAAGRRRCRGTARPAPITRASIASIRPGARGEAGAAVGEGADARQHDALGAAPPPRDRR